MPLNGIDDQTFWEVFHSFFVLSLDLSKQNLSCYIIRGNKSFHHEWHIFFFSFVLSIISWAYHNIGWLLRKHNYHLYQVSQFTNAWSGSPGAKNKHLFSAFIAFDDYSCLYIRSHYAKDIRVCSICPFSDDFLVWWHGTYFMDYIPYVVWLYVVRDLRISHYHFFAIDLISSADYIGILSTNYKR